MVSPMRRVNELVSEDMGNYLTNFKSWNPVAYNVLEYKLLGDGTTNDTAALQALVDRANEEGRKAIYFPHGQYYVTALTGADQVVFFGDNASFVGGYAGTIYQMGDWATNAQLAETASNTTVMNASIFGAVGDYDPDTGEGTDDSDAIQAGFDYLFAQGGGTLYLPENGYKITRPILIKTPADLGGYDYPLVTIQGKANRGSAIYKVGTTQAYSLDAAIIMVSGDSLDLNDAFSGVGYSNIKIINTSTAATVYAVYGKTGSRILANYSSFATIRSIGDVNSHDRYAFFVNSFWSCSFRDCTFHGDYGIYNASESTSLLLENIFVGTDKIGVRLVGVYSTLINVYGDMCNGTMFYFNFASVHCTALGGESRNCHTMIHANNSHVTIDNAFFLQSNVDDGTVIMANGSTVTIQQLVVDMYSTTAGYLWKGGTIATVTVNQLRMIGAATKFKYSAANSMATDVLRAFISPAQQLEVKGVRNLLPFTSNYWDWYCTTPTLPINNIIMGLKAPTTYTDNGNAQFASGGILNGFYVNANFSERAVLGWGRYAQSSSELGSGSNWYVPFILSGPTANRPTWRTLGMMYFDTTLGKPIWWNGTNWVDAAATIV